MDATSSGKGQSIVSTIENVKLNDLTKEFWSLRKGVVEQQKQIDGLKDQQGNINDRLRAQERYTRKDGVLIINSLLKPEQLKMLRVRRYFFLKKCCNSSWPIVIQKHAISCQGR